MLNGKKLIIFDCDGVLFNSQEANISYFNQCLQIAGYPPIQNELRDFVTYMSILQLINKIIPDQNEAERVLNISRTVEYDSFIDKLIPLFDFRKVLTPLNNKFFLAVASNRGISLTKLFRHFNLFRYFHFKVSTLEAKPKPDPEMLFKCMNYFNAEIPETIFIGDSISDRMTADNSGIDFIQIGNDKEVSQIESVENLLNYI